MDANQYTPSGLVDYMNTIFKCKANLNPFTMLDIQQYVRHGRIPLKYGKIKIVKTRDIRNKITILSLESE